MEEQDSETQSSGSGGEEETLKLEPEGLRHDVEDQHVLQFLDSLDGYITLMDSLSLTLRQGWLELASARHSMGASRVNSALLNLKFHSASTSLQVTRNDVDSEANEANFTLCKWASSNSGHSSAGEKFREDKLQTKHDSPDLRHRSKSQFSDLEHYDPNVLETPDETSVQSGASLVADDHVQRERSKSLSVFGTLVSPKLRAAQLSFETALEMLVEIANTRSTMLSAFNRVKKGLEDIKS
ncbi:hypothetical protein FEM48_Zijuj06G0006200 [Ziziphus jujuba var. spinosa]|uniref:Vacuolar ATPase assembly protein VMA22 n=1 Tax=Ziziphus jujuba var. spinosa TaxID=714518 RepID=A0A978V658_ZIZJJ|nr:hypothetical protein FEM48_Zijuj06G0006200 [Ziziphus jujuba var. spinosa]